MSNRKKEKGFFINLAAKMTKSLNPALALWLMLGLGLILVPIDCGMYNG